MSKVSVNGTNLHYLSTGQGPDVIMIHGLGANLAFWYLHVVSRLASEFRVTAYDLRGHGYSDMPQMGYTPADMVADLHGLLNHLGLESVHLVGHSFGGAVALNFTAQFPDRVASLTLADARVRALHPKQRIKDWQYWPRWKAQLQAAGMSLPDEEEELDFMLLEDWAQPQWQDVRRRLSTPHRFVPFGTGPGSKRAAQRWLRLLQSTTARDDFRQHVGVRDEQIRELRQPMLAIYGQHSHCLETLWKLKESVPDCRVVIVPGVGHFHPVVRQKFFVHHLRAFLQDQVAQ
jgi:pimeloyl-ACP methyl ester carboxylesterase